MPSDRFVVYEGKRERDPAVAVRVVAPDGRAVHVISADGLRQTHDEPLLSLADAITEAFRRADRPLPRVDLAPGR